MDMSNNYVSVKSVKLDKQKNRVWIDYISMIIYTYQKWPTQRWKPFINFRLLPNQEINFELCPVK